MPPAAPAHDVETLLAGLNYPQREAVIHGEGPLLILAGAGSGKTRVLTHRIAYLCKTDAAHPNEILAITFTNKAAQEMRDRVGLLLGRSVRAMWVMTFHAACARMLRADAHRLGYTRQFTIYDQADARRLTKRCISNLDVDPKRFTPAAIHSQISDAKNKLRMADDYRQMVGSFFEQTVADVYDLYERELHRANAMDFDDLLVRAVNVLELFPEVRERYQRAFRHVLVDEYQDTNHAQYRWLQLLTIGTDREPGAHRNLAVVGDDDQCLVEGTPVTMADGSTKPIEQVRVGDEVLSCYGSGDFRPSRVTDTFRSEEMQGIAITMRSGRRIVSTARHVHFAGFHPAHTPPLHMTYLMWRHDKGFRVGVTRTRPFTSGSPVSGVQLRCNQEHADAAWIVGTHSSDAEARVQELSLSLRYQIPTLPFKARMGKSMDGVVCNQALIDRVFNSIDSEAGGQRLLADHGLRFERPHHIPRTFEGRRRNVTLTLCGDNRGRTPMHTIAVGGRDAGARKAIEEMELSVRPAKSGSDGWRYESCFKDFGHAIDMAQRVGLATPVSVRCVARFGTNSSGIAKNTLPFTEAASVRPGMAMFTEDGGYDVVDSVERVEMDRPVYDINVETTHNFIAGGLITHNSIYAFRGADVRNILDFEDDFPDARVVKLEQNYRSTQTILSAANAVVSNNRGRKSKSLWTDLGEGDPIRVRELDDEHAEARFVTGEIQKMVDEGVSRAEIAVFYRVNAQSRVLEDTLVRNDIGYQVIGGTKFYERAEVKDAIAYLNLLGNPQDSGAFARVANSPRRGIGQTSLSRVLAHANTTGIPIWEAAAEPEAIPALGAAAVKALGRFMGTMKVLAERAGGGAPIGELLEETLRETGYLEALELERTIEAQGRTENLEELIEVGREYDRTAEEASLDGFLQQIALVADVDRLEDDEGLVTLMTLHNAKGLEYPIVFMIGCEEGLFPHSRALDEGDVEEERRLCYVGITRAQRDLYITYARTRTMFGSREFGLRSRFIDEIPADLTDRAESLRPTSGYRAGQAATSWGAGRSDAPAPDFRMGDDVVHPAFGEGVVTANEPGGIVVIRFAKDGTERKLVADLAPLTKR